MDALVVGVVQSDYEIILILPKYYEDLRSVGDWRMRSRLPKHYTLYFIIRLLNLNTMLRHIGAKHIVMEFRDRL